MAKIFISKVFFILALFNGRFVLDMVVILDGNSEIGSTVGREIDYLICIMHLFTSTAADDF